jgi:RNA polymerase sigma-70 factor (ECF subfamily)
MVTKPARSAARPATPQQSGALAHALEEAFERHQSELLGTLYYLVGNLEDARDALQEAFVKCWRHQDKVAEVQNLKAWIFRIALNTGRDLRETAWRRKRQHLPDDEALPAAPGLAPDEQLEQDDRLARLRAALSELRAEEKEVFLLRQNGELTYEEIGDTLGIPSGTVKTRMRMALQRLRHVLGVTPCQNEA